MIPFGKYQLISRVAAGGMAEVYRARLVGAGGFERIVAIKKILPQYSSDPEFIAQFTEEAKISAQLVHKNIVQIFDFGQVGGDWYIAMEFVDGLSLHELLKLYASHRRLLPYAISTRILADVATALDFAHNATGPTGEPLNIVHRDISSKNVMIGFDGSVKLMDFGIAKAAGRSYETQSGVIKGKIAYLAPEQIKCEPLDGRTDLFALGVVAYEMYTGSRPFTGDSDVQVLYKVLSEPTPDPRTRNPQLPLPLRAICLRLLEKDPGDRFQQAGDVRDALDRALAEVATEPAAADVERFIRGLLENKVIERRQETELSPPAASGDAPPVPGAEPTVGIEPMDAPVAAEVPAVGRRHRRWPARLVAALIVGGLVGAGALALRHQNPLRDRLVALIQRPPSVNGATPVSGPPQQLTTATVRARSSPPPPPAATNTLTPTSGATPAPPRTPRPGTPATVRRRIRVATRPDTARLLIDGNPIDGTSPFEVVLVGPPASRHKVQALAPCRRGMERTLRLADLDAQETTSIDLELPLELRPVEIISKPPGATISFGGKRLGTTPARVDLPPKGCSRQLLRITHNGYLTREVPLPSSPQVSVRLDPVPASGLVVRLPFAMSVSVDGADKGTLSPPQARLSLPPGTVSLRFVSRRPFYVYETRATVVKGDIVPVDVPTGPLSQLSVRFTDACEASIDGVSIGSCPLHEVPIVADGGIHEIRVVFRAAGRAPLTRLEKFRPGVPIRVP